MDSGTRLENFTRDSAKKQESLGLSIRKTSPPVMGRIQSDGSIKGRVVSKGDLDWTGDFNGVAAKFDTKSCAGKASFPLNLLKRHQVVILKNAHARGVVAFFLVELTALGPPVYLRLTWPILEPFWKEAEGGGAQSIKLVVLIQSCKPIPMFGSRKRYLNLAETITEGRREVAFD